MRSIISGILPVALLSIIVSSGCNDLKSKTENKTAAIDTTHMSATYKTLIEDASAVRMNAYAPYSKFLVGAAVVGESGKIYKGCNVENASYGLTICAERNAVFQAVAAGEKRIKAIAIVLDAPDFGAPCGACRQVIYEFGNDIDVIMATTHGNYKIEKINSLLPYAFGPQNLDK